MTLLCFDKMQAVLEKQSYILLSRSDVESLMRLDPANASLQNSFGQLENYIPEAEGVEVEIELSDLLLDMGPIKQVFHSVSHSFHAFLLWRYVTGSSCQCYGK
jgi:hypothetical protein